MFVKRDSEAIGGQCPDALLFLKGEGKGMGEGGANRADGEIGTAVQKSALL